MFLRSDGNIPSSESDNKLAPNSELNQEIFESNPSQVSITVAPIKVSSTKVNPFHQDIDLTTDTGKKCTSRNRSNFMLRNTVFIIYVTILILEQELLIYSAPLDS